MGLTTHHVMSMLNINIDVYSHGIRLHGYSRRVFDALAIFLDGLQLKEEKRLPPHQGGRMVMEVKKRFFGMLGNKREVYLHRNQLESVVRHLKQYSLNDNNFIIEYFDPPKPKHVEIEVFDKFVPREHQVEMIEEMSDDLYSRKVDLFTGGGKDQPLFSPIKIPGGWSTMGDMKVGTVVTAMDGTPSNVTGVYPQGKKIIYSVMCSDGRVTQAGADHLWRVYIANAQKGKRWKTLTTTELKWYVERNQSRAYLPLCLSEQGNDVDLPIDPYLLGVLLGDGGMSGSGINITKLDEDLFTNVSERLPEGLKFVARDHKTRGIVKADGWSHNSLRANLKAMNLMGTRSWEKYIPDEYLNASHQQRLDLLNGLLDTDGYVSAKDQPGSVRKSGSISFTSTSVRLSKAVQHLVRSLGGVASITPKVKSFTYKGEKKHGRQVWQVNIRHPKPSILFKIERKKKRCSDDGQYSDILKLRVTSVEPVGVEETQCISIDHPDRLYITDDFIVTHNTYSALQACVNRGELFVVMVAPKYFGIWIKALNETLVGFADTPGSYITVSGSAELKNVMQIAMDGLLEAKVVIISNTTYRNYLENYEYLGEEAARESGYLVPPPRFHELIGAGVQINDEFHEDLGLTFRIDVYSNVSKQLYLSATPYSGDEYVTKMVDIMLPTKTHCTVPQPPKYINVMELLYNDDVKRSDYLTPFKNTYNHARYEKQMLKQKRRRQKYFDNVVKVVDKIFVSTKQPGQKLLIICSTVDFILELTKYMRLKFPTTKIGHYVSGVPYTELEKNEITVSTLKSAGTGVDIPNLRDTLLLQAVNSRKDNIQLLGRTRPLKDYPDVTPRLVYLTCLDIPQHRKYAKFKKEVFNNRIKNSRTLRI